MMIPSEVIFGGIIVALGYFSWQQKQDTKKYAKDLLALKEELGMKNTELALTSQEKYHLATHLRTIQEDLEEKNRLTVSLRERFDTLFEEHTKIEAQYKAQIEKHEALKDAFLEQKKALKEEMSNTMQKLLESKLEKFDETSIKGLEMILKPFSENIEGFKKRIEENQKESGERVAALSKEIELMIKAGISIGEEASNLTKALKGDKQTQGRWGEMVLESVLEKSGLLKNDHYTIQENYKDENGKDKRPDVIVKLPGERSIVIDSKVSLVDYDRFIGGASDEERNIAAAGIAKAFRNHIDTLHGKEYIEYDVGTLQYVFMFVPIEGAYAVAVRHDPHLYEYALKKHIIIVYPSTLVVSLKTIYLYWQREKSDIAVELIYQEAGKLYEKVYGFVETFERVGKQLETVNLSYQKAKIQLYDGSGNILTRSEKLRELGAKTTKNLKSLKVKNSQLAIEDEEMEIVVCEEGQDENS